MLKIACLQVGTGWGVAYSGRDGPKLIWQGLQKSRMGFQVFRGCGVAQLARNCNQPQVLNRKK